ncbi:MAG: hypothetical protein ACSHXB_16545 [Sulfitobacter sp.]
MPAENWDDKGDKTARHPEPGKSRVEVSVISPVAVTVKDPKDQEESTFRAFTDEAAQAALGIADQSGQRIQTYQNIVSALALFNVTICGAVLSHYHAGSVNGAAIVPTGLTALGLVVLLVVNSLIALQAYAGISYHQVTQDTASSIARKHFRLSQIHWNADRKYRKVERLAPRLFNSILTIGLAGIAISMPLITAVYVFLNFS